MNALRFARWTLQHAADVDCDWERFNASLLHRHAITLCIFAVGELVKYVKYDLKTEIPHIPWSKLIGMRDILAHKPAKVNLSIVWGVVTDDFPRLIEVLEPMLETTPRPADGER